MFNNPNFYFFILKVISASMNNELYLDKQPTIFMPKIAPNSCLDDKVHGGLSLEGIFGVDKIISLEFSINHSFAVENWTKSNSDLFKFQHIQIELKKYKKKPKKYKRKFDGSVKYNESVSNPETIFISKHGYRKHGYLLLVSPFLRTSNLVKLNKNCQHVLIYSEAPFGKKISVRDLKKSVEDLKKFLELNESDDPSDFAYKFFIELNNAYPPNTWSETKTISSNMFQFVFNDTSLLINLIEVDEKYFI